MEGLTARGIGSSIYYPQPVPRMTHYREKYGCDAAQYAHAARLSDCSIALPVGPHLSPSEMGEIASEFRLVLKEVA
jgi:dTDP-4-amino-4,6-dideoxygalactose transaminase